MNNAMDNFDPYVRQGELIYDTLVFTRYSTIARPNPARILHVYLSMITITNCRSLSIS